MIRRLIIICGFFLLLFTSNMAHSEYEQPVFEVKDPAITENFRKIYYDADKLSILTIPLERISNSTTNAFYIDNPHFWVDLSSHLVRVGVGPVKNQSATVVTSGGSLAAGNTYYYRVYPFSSGDKVGHVSAEMIRMITTNGSRVDLAWDLLPGASYYRVTRGTIQGGEDGYFQTTALSYSDTGGSFTSSGNGITGTSSLLFEVAGSMTLPAGSGIGWTDPTDGTRRGSLAVTSAGEMEFQTTRGRAESSYYFNDSSGSQRMAWTFDTDPSRWYWNQTQWQIRVSTVEFNLQETGSTIIFNGTALQLLKFTTNTIVASVPFTNGGQPSFKARVNSSSANVTGDGSVYLMRYGVESWDTANNFNTSTFTTTIAGKYHFCASVDLAGILAGHTARRINILHNGTIELTNYADLSLASTNFTIPVCGTMNMAVGDTATVTTSVSGATPVVDIENDGGGGFFQGHLVH